MSPNIILLMLFVLIIAAIAMNLQSSKEISIGEKFDETLDDIDSDNSLYKQKHMKQKYNTNDSCPIREFCKICNKMNYKNKHKYRKSYTKRHIKYIDDG